MENDDSDWDMRWHYGKPLYEIFVRSYSEEGKLSKLTSDLDRIQNLGINQGAVLTYAPSIYDLISDNPFND